MKKNNSENNSIIQVESLVTRLNNRLIHKNINIFVNEGENLAIIGGSGSGKSVLLKIILGLLKAESGSVKLFGTEIINQNENTIAELRKNVGVLFQNGALFDSLTIGENVSFFLDRNKLFSKNKIKKLVKEKLELVGLSGVEDRMPSEISIGMAKRAGLARAIILNPKIIFYDEPTTGIDPIMADIINDLILKLKKELNVTSIIVSHDMKSTYKVSDRISMIYKGEIIFTGTPDDIKLSKDIYVQNFINGDSKGLSDCIG